MEFESIQEIFNKSFDMTEWKGVLKRLFSNFDEYRSTIDRLEPNLTYHEKAQEINEFGSILLADNKVIKLYDVLLKGDYDVAKSRVGLRNMIFRDIVPGDMDGILAVYRSENGKTWRLTFISKAIYWDDDFNEQKLQTSPRRYTYVLGEDESVKTAAKQFESLFNKKVTIKQLIEAFNVDKLNKRFFSDYQKHYEKFVLELTGEVWKKKQNKYVLTKIQEPSPLLKTAFYNNKKHARDFCKKLLGRIVFLHFLQKKGWMGCAIDDKLWENGEKQFMLELFNGFEDKNHFHSKCLTELFFNTLNEPNRNDIFEVEGLSNHLNGSKVPYLNGGLFETDTNCDPYKVDFPPVFFEELLDFFGQYNFTIDENSPDDHEVGIDPEMLGHIFENLLEENKEKGAFYTPKEIVQYMTQESLIQYLQTHLGEHEELSNFIRNNDIGDRTAKHNYIRDNAAQIEELLDNVKICDPAIGSGAFPMGMLNEIFEAKMALDMTLNRSEVKKKIIQNSIYGVDLESGAVDIARLRFWLALVVDEDEPHALPNLDYKIMQGNSLLESFEGIDLSEIHKGKAITIDDENSGDNLFSKVMEVQEVYNEEKLEDLIKTYFDLDNPVEKKKQHDKIDKQILGKIYKCLFDEHEELEIELKKLNRKIKNKSASLSTADQKIKYESTSKDAKNAKKLRDQIDSIAQKQLKLKELYESDDRPFFLWHLMFQDVFENGGFDIVIGNPPYVDSETMVKNDKDLRELIKSNYKTAQGNWDLFIPFVELSLKLSRSNGQFCFIIPNKLIGAKYTTELRYYLSNTEIKEIRDYSEIDVFKEASVYPITLIVNKRQPGNPVEMTKMNSLTLIDYSNTIKSDKFYNDISWGKYFFEPHIVRLIQTIESNIALKDHFKNVEVLGAATVNEAYQIKEYLEDREPSNSDFKFINTGTIDPYLSLWGAKETQYIKGQYLHPVIIKENIKSINKTRFDQAQKQKLIIAGMAKSFETFFDLKGEYLAGKSTTIVLDNEQNLKFIASLLNSKISTFYLNYVYHSLKMSGGFLNIGTDIVKNLPISNINKEPINIVFDYVNYSFDISSNLNENSEKLKWQVIAKMFEEILDALILESYFKNEFQKRQIQIGNLVEEELGILKCKNVSEMRVQIMKSYTLISEKKNPLRNQIKLMKIELKQLLNPILSV